MNPKKRLIKLLPHSYSPYSHYAVAALLLADDGQYYASINVENASYPLSTCAERGAVSAMLSAGAKRIREVWVMTRGDKPGTPCGGCRQILAEFAEPEVAVHCFTEGGLEEHYTVGQLLPFGFKLKLD